MENKKRPQRDSWKVNEARGKGREKDTSSYHYIDVVIREGGEVRPGSFTHASVCPLPVARTGTQRSLLQKSCMRQAQSRTLLCRPPFKCHRTSAQRAKITQRTPREQPSNSRRRHRQWDIEGPAEGSVRADGTSLTRDPFQTCIGPFYKDL